MESISGSPSWWLRGAGARQAEREGEGKGGGGEERDKTEQAKDFSQIM